MKGLIIKGSLVTLLASSSVLTGLGTFAEAEGNLEAESTQSIELQANSETTTIDKLEATTTTEAEVEGDSEIDLFPGDFFYFFKVILEKLQVTLTFNDQEKAELLADFAGERIAEAEVLMKEGNEELAFEVLQKAVITIQNSEEFIVASEGEGNVSSKKEDATEEGNQEHHPQSDVTTEEDVEQNEAEVVSEEGVDLEVELEGKISQNIIALKNVIEKIQNPKAKAALERNIAKSLVKFEERLAKLQAKAKKKTNTDTKADATINVENSLEIATVEGETQNETNVVAESNFSTAPITGLVKERIDEGHKIKQQVNDKIKKTNKDVNDKDRENKTEVKAEVKVNVFGKRDNEEHGNE
jgi:hypothetical protein